MGQAGVALVSFMDSLPPSPTPATRVFTMHGVISRLKPDCCAQRGLFETAKFVQHLQSRSKPYVELYSAMGGKGDALTIDDATHAGCEAALLARQHGHAVTLFINPGHVIERKPYFLVLLSLVVDRTKLPWIIFQGTRYELGSFERKRDFREHLKQHLMTLGSEALRDKFIHTIARRLQVANLSVPCPLQTVGLATLHKLRNQGVVFGNHGWTHATLATLTAEAGREDIAAARKWIRQKLGCDGNIFAAPYGCQLPTFRPRADLYAMWFLSFNMLSPGFIGPQVYNRVSLSL